MDSILQPGERSLVVNQTLNEIFLKVMSLPKVLSEKQLAKIKKNLELH